MDTDTREKYDTNVTFMTRVVNLPSMSSVPVYIYVKPTVVPVLTTVVINNAHCTLVFVRIIHSILFYMLYIII